MQQLKGFKPIDLQQAGPPGARIAARRCLVSRPGHPDYVQEQLIRACDDLVGNPGVRQLVGDELDVRVSREPGSGALLFFVMPRP